MTVYKNLGHKNTSAESAAIAQALCYFFQGTIPPVQSLPLFNFILPKLLTARGSAKNGPF